MKNQFTPGPWDVQNKGTLGGRSARHEVVAGTFGGYGDGRNLPTIAKMPDLSEQSYANARLLAAAPELLQAGQVALGALLQRRTRIGNDDIDVAVQYLRQAIAKAEGK